MAKIPEFVKNLLWTLESAGHQAWCVGGCVRDLRLGREPVDWDVTTSALPEETVSRLSLLLARNYDVGLGRRDVEMYLDRLEQSVPKSASAGGMTGEQLEEYMEQLRRKKG